MHLVTSGGMGQATGQSWPRAAITTYAPRTYYDPGSLNANAAGMVTEKWDEATREWWPVNPYLGRSTGPILPPGFTAPTFDCPAGSDYAKSVEAGMCVDANNNRDSTVAGESDDPESQKRDTSEDWIPGIPNTFMVGVGGFLFMMWVRK